MVNGLGILCAARDALTLDELGRVAGWTHEPQRRAFLRGARELLIETRRAGRMSEYRLHHDSIRAYVAEAIGRDALAAHHLALAQRLATWPARADAAAQRYALHHALLHRAEAGGRCGGTMLAIRGISDIVGLKRADAWTQYACASAAAFTRAFLRTRPIELGAAASDAAESSQATSQAPARASQDRPVGSPPTEERHMTREELLHRLERLLPSQFEAVVFRAGVPTAYLPGATASQTERAIAVIRYLELQDQLDPLARIVQQVVTGGRPAGSGPR